MEELNQNELLTIYGGNKAAYNAGYKLGQKLRVYFDDAMIEIGLIRYLFL